MCTATKGLEDYTRVTDIGDDEAKLRVNGRTARMETDVASRIHQMMAVQAVLLIF